MLAGPPPATPAGRAGLLRPPILPWSPRELDRRLLDRCSLPSLGADVPVAPAQQPVGDLRGVTVELEPRLVLVAPVGIADHLQLTGGHLHPVDQTGVVGCRLATPAPGLDLDLLADIGQFEELVSSQTR